MDVKCFAKLSQSVSRNNFLMSDEHFVGISLFVACVDVCGIQEPLTGSLFAACVLGHSLCSFAYGVLGKFTGQKQPDGGLDLAGANGRLLVIVRQSRSFCGDAFENIVYERVHDAHGFTRDSSVRVNLLENFINVYGIAFLALP